MRVFRVDLKKPDGMAVDAAARAIAKGEIICYPTETQYGLGGSALSESVCREINEQKGREPDSPLIVLILEKDAGKWISEPGRFQIVLDKFWPGPLTIIVDPPPEISFPKPPIGPNGGIAIRAASLPVNIKLLERCGVPIISTSANLSGREPGGKIDTSDPWFAGFCSVLLDAGELESLVPSTIADIRDFPKKIKILREGAVPVSSIVEAFPETEILR